MQIKEIVVDLKELLLDPNNFRLDYKGDFAVIEDARIEALQKEVQSKLELERIDDLRKSILKNGFLEMDRIVVRKLETPSNTEKYVVVEGNRRTAAFKSLMRTYESGESPINQTLLNKSRSINVILLEGEKPDINKYSASLMGVRHVSGPKRWSGYQSARLIDQLKEAGDSFDDIGEMLGITSRDAERRYRGFHAVKQMRENSAYKHLAKNTFYTLFLEFLTPNGEGWKWLEWDDIERRFKNKNNTTRLYEAIAPIDGSEPELTNPTKAREFIKKLKNSRSREEIESGTKYYDAYTPGSSERDRLRELTRFSNFLERYNWSNATEAELSSFRSIRKKMDAISKELG
ncbi:ParB/Srx family N-terminal domain-containing protein [Halieaceae bacterium]|nr:ParB/Srx family N-terminal domain-containing protein [Halieaceae bacterium]